MQTDNSFLSACTSGGCGAKIGPGELADILQKLPKFNDDRLLIGFDGADDAAVYRLDDDRSMISTVDFFSPMVNDPRSFGRIAATNALSDVYAMGGTPALALNLVCFPQKMDKAYLGEMLAGGAEKIAEAGAVLGGGHSIYDKEPKYGLAVTGFVQNDAILRNNTPNEGHLLLLTKPLGVGIVMAAARGGEASDEAVKAAVYSMERLNKYSAACLAGYDVSACTDITGFGLLAHLLEMCGEGVSAQIWPGSLPVLPGAKEYANDFLVTAAGQRNRNYFGTSGMVDSLEFAVQELLFDPQTSGGLLICVAEKQAQALLEQIQQTDPMARIIGCVLPKGEQTIVFKGESHENN